mmetsp:Transcript_82830/g.165319  ORF Transcript_82830/g.165319 Transcript_82830/m.165319 type:complete len:233 (+) Transcript_82830:1130-1828(+)
MHAPLDLELLDVILAEDHGHVLALQRVWLRPKRAPRDVHDPEAANREVHGLDKIRVGDGSRDAYLSARQLRPKCAGKEVITGDDSRRNEIKDWRDGWDELCDIVLDSAGHSMQTRQGRLRLIWVGTSVALQTSAHATDGALFGANLFTLRGIVQVRHAKQEPPSAGDGTLCLHVTHAKLHDVPASHVAITPELPEGLAVVGPLKLGKLCRELIRRHFRVRLPVARFEPFVEE